MSRLVYIDNTGLFERPNDFLRIEKQSSVNPAKPRSDLAMIQWVSANISGIASWRLRLAWVVGCALLAPLSAVGQVNRAVEFNRQVRPILADRCFRCHGPDPSQRQAELRLDVRESAIELHDDHPAILPGEPGRSELMNRIKSTDPSLRMPPPETGEPLSAADVQLLSDWISQGADYDPFWSLVPPRLYDPPQVTQPQWLRRPLDRWVMAKLETEGLEPASEASRQMLARRAALDLTGLPLSSEQLIAFLSDQTPDAYERLLDRLLASPRYGERRAQFWLDAARYADTHGYFVDGERTMWRWRDWVIDALNANQPFDQFTIEQLAGDLLPAATSDQRIATGFNRNHTATNETGVIDEEYRISYVMDRLETTATVWLGLTLNCARCHAHKFDPVSQREYYQLLAYFNQVPEKGNIQTEGNSQPMISTPTAEQSTQLTELQLQKKAADAAWDSIESQVQQQLERWRSTAQASLEQFNRKGLLARFSFEEDLPFAPAARTAQERVTADGNSLGEVDRGCLLASQQERPPKYGSSLVGRAVDLDAYSHCVFSDDRAFDFASTTPFTIGAWIYPTSGSAGCIFSKTDDRLFLRGYDLLFEKGKLVAHLNHRAESDAIRVRSVSGIATNRWQHVAIAYDGSGHASGLTMYIDGKPVATTIEYDNLRGSIGNAQPFRVGRRSESLGFTGLIDEVNIFNRVLDAKDLEAWVTGESISSALRTKSEELGAAQQQRLLEHFLKSTSEQWWKTYAEKSVASAKLLAFEKQLPTTMVMLDQPEARKTFVLVRGQYDQPSEEVKAGIPSALTSAVSQYSPDSDPLPSNRYQLARWLVSSENPLTARVTVNRIWQQLFGVGIVKTVEDFGAQGEWPSHPQLLDELAIELLDSSWDIKFLMREILTSATYRQSSSTAAQAYQRDPENRLLARGPRFRLEAEVVRDSALAVAGLLNNRIGGESVKPYQPPGLWEAVSYNGDHSYVQDRGEGLYRRSLYTFWKRQSPPPASLVWDAPTRETCQVARSRTNTPLQALVLMNDTTYVEASRVWAKNLVREAASIDSQWYASEESPVLLAAIEQAFIQLLCRRPTRVESETLLKLYRQQWHSFQAMPEEAVRLLNVGESREAVDTANTKQSSATAALANVLHVIVNLDETVTKE